MVTGSFFVNIGLKQANIGLNRLLATVFDNWRITLF